MLHIKSLHELSPRLLLHFPDEILDPVCMLFEKSLREGRGAGGLETGKRGANL